MVGLVLTPAAVVASLMLLQSPRPVRNLLVFAAAFVAPYVVIAASALMGTSAEPGTPPAHPTATAWVQVTVGTAFLVLGLAVLLRSGAGPARASRNAGLGRMLDHPDPANLVVAGVALAVVNPNVAILVSGLNTVVESAQSRGEQLTGVVLLLGAALVDFLLPLLVHVCFGARAQRWLDPAARWTTSHSRLLALLVLFCFGALFLVRGLDYLL
jgi:threonine/homoserine/homoserine lactone efflux protein